MFKGDIRNIIPAGRFINKIRRLNIKSYYAKIRTPMQHRQVYPRAVAVWQCVQSAPSYARSKSPSKGPTSETFFITDATQEILPYYAIIPTGLLERRPETNMRRTASTWGVWIGDW